MRRLLLLTLGIALIFTSCKDDADNSSNNGNPNNPTTSGANPQLSGNTVNASFMGRVTDKETFDPIEGALVKIGNETTTTNELGLYLIENVQVDENFAWIQITANGYFDQFKNLKPKAGQTNMIDALMIDKTFTGAFESSAGGEVPVGGGQGKVIFSPDAFVVNSDGSPYSGQVIVATTYLNPTDPNINSYVPGSMLAVESDDDLAVLTTFGMMKVEMVGSGGQTLDLADGEMATLEFPVQPDQAGYAPVEIPLWYFDEATGIWREEGQATRSGDKYIGDVSHFTFWNCDVANETANLTGLFTYHQDPYASNSIKLKMVRTEFNNNWAYANQNVDGSFYSFIPANESIDLYIVNDVCSEEFFHMTLGPQNANSDVELSEIAVEPYLGDSEIIDISATVLDCEGNPVNSGTFEYAVEGTNISGFMNTQTDGTIEFPIAICEPQTINYSAVAMDNTGSILGQTGTFEIDPNSSDMNLGNVFLCEDSSPEGSYISYSDEEGNSSLNSPVLLFPYGSSCMWILHDNEQESSYLAFENPLTTGPVDICDSEEEYQIIFYGTFNGGNTIYAEFDDETALINITQLEFVGDSISLIMGTYEGEAFVTVRDESQTVIDVYTTNAQGLFRHEP